MKEKLSGINKPLEEQIDILKQILLTNKKLIKILEILEQEGIENCYIGGGSINQTVFNYYHDYDADYGIKDYDIVYYDLDTSYEKEDIIIKKLEKILKPLNVLVDIKNQARVHIWYYEKFGIKRTPYTSVEDAISSWTTTITCIGIKLEKGQIIICAPYGLNDIFNMELKPVKKNQTKEIYNKKTKEWMSKWPKLTKIDW